MIEFLFPLKGIKPTTVERRSNQPTELTDFRSIIAIEMSTSADSVDCEDQDSRQMERTRKN